MPKMYEEMTIDELKVHSKRCLAELLDCLPSSNEHRFWLKALDRTNSELSLKQYPQYTKT